MIFHAKTTLVIDDDVVRRLRQEAAWKGMTFFTTVAAALRLFLEVVDPMA